MNKIERWLPKKMENKKKEGRPHIIQQNVDAICMLNR